MTKQNSIYIRDCYFHLYIEQLIYERLLNLYSFEITFYSVTERVCSRDLQY